MDNSRIRVTKKNKEETEQLCHFSSMHGLATIKDTVNPDDAQSATLVHSAIC